VRRVRISCRPTFRLACNLAFFLACCLAGAARAQQAELEVPSGPHYIGTPIEIRVIATGFDEEPVPVSDAPTPNRGRLDFVGVVLSTHQSFAIVDGQLRRTREVRFVYRYRYVASEPGHVQIGPFSVRQASVERVTNPVRLKIGELAASDRLDVRIELPQTPVFVGQRIPVVLEFSLETALQKNLHTYTLQAPLFDRTESFHFIDDLDPAATTDVEIETESGTRRLRGTTREEVRGRARFLVVRVERAMILLRPGSFEIEPASLVVDEATRWKRDFFGGRQVTHVRKLRAADRARTLQVGAVPVEDRPESFAGAVGRGYTLEVSADRSVVQVGDPITLTLTLRGEGNLDTAGLPPLSSKGLLDPTRFRVPAGDLTGKLEGEAKRFTAIVRVQDEDVREIPALEYSWFDAATQTYQTTRSRPIALSVRAAEVVSAADVISSESAQRLLMPQMPEAAGGAGAAEAASAGVPVRGVGGVMSFTGADLAIVRDIPTLARGASSQLGGRTRLAGLYLVPCLLLGIALLDRRRRAVDPEVIRLRKRLETQRRRIRAAAKQPGREGVRELADAVRQMLAELPDARSAEIDAFLGKCDALIYAPDAATRESSAVSEAELRERAAYLADAIRSHAR
jgi:hypothetical protein